MLISPAVNFVNNNIRPVARDPAIQFVYKITVEIVKIVAAKIFLEIIVKRFLNGPSIMPNVTNFTIVVMAPLVEEIFFRGIVLKGIFLAQKLVNWTTGAVVDGNKKLNQQIFRVHLTALLFGLVHLMNPHKTAIGAARQASSAELMGEDLGYMTEKHHSIVPAILSHALNNGMVVACIIYQVSLPLSVAALFVKNMVMFLLSRPAKPSFVPAIISHTFSNGILSMVLFMPKNPSSTSLALPLFLGALAVNRLVLYFFLYRAPKISPLSTHFPQ